MNTNHNDLAPKTWYAVRYNEDWDWDYGSHDLEEAKRLAIEHGYNEIASVNEQTNFCLGVWTYDGEYWTFEQ